MDKKTSAEAALGIYQKLLLQQFILPCLLLNQEEKILLINGDVGKILPDSIKLSNGNLLDESLGENIYQQLHNGIQEVIKGEESVMIKEQSSQTSYFIYISALASPLVSEKLILIEFEDANQQNLRKVISNLPAQELQQSFNTLVETTEHDIKNMVINLILLLNLEETNYTKADKIQDVKKMQEQFLDSFAKNVNQIKQLLDLPLS